MILIVPAAPGVTLTSIGKVLEKNCVVAVASVGSVGGAPPSTSGIFALPATLPKTGVQVATPLASVNTMFGPAWGW